MQPTTEEQLITLHLAGVAPRVIATALKISTAQVNATVAEWQAKTAQKAKELLTRDVKTPLTIQASDWMVTSDWHVPFTDWGLFEKMVMIAEKHLRRPRRLVCAGDLFNMDAFSNFQHVTLPANWSEERSSAKELLSYCLGVFDEIYLLTGNHDARLMKWSQGQLESDDIFGMVLTNTKVLSSRFAYMTAQTCNGLWRFTHPEGYRQGRTVLAQTLADDLQMNVISGHEHHTGVTASKTGRYVACNIGGLYKPEHLDYVMRADRIRPHMTPGFAMLRDGYVDVFGDPLTRWEAWV